MKAIGLYFHNYTVISRSTKSPKHIAGINVNHNLRPNFISLVVALGNSYKPVNEGILMKTRTSSYALAQSTKPPNKYIRYDLRQTTLHSTQVKGIVKGISDLLMQVPSGI